MEGKGPPNTVQNGPVFTEISFVQGLVERSPAGKIWESSVHTGGLSLLGVGVVQRD